VKIGRLGKPDPVRLTYGEKFECIGSACEDTCCKNWTIPVDQITYEKYRSLTPTPLNVLINESIAKVEEERPGEATGPTPTHYANILLDESQKCPLLADDGLCRVQKECGADHMCYTCATYPRIKRRVGEVDEISLTLSCPEAARRVLLDPDLLMRGLPHPEASGLISAERSATSSTTVVGKPADEAVTLLDSYWSIRKSVLSIVRNRNYELWQRMFLLGVLCRILDSVGTGAYRRNVSEVLVDFETSVADGSLRPSIDTLPLDCSSQLDVVLRLAGLMLHHSHVSARFGECIQAFTTGIGNGPSATLATLTSEYVAVHDRYYAPFFQRFPHILENYLVNTIIRCEFPFGREAMTGTKAPVLGDEYALLTAQFALIKGLLIGVSGFQRESFAASHVVHTCQAAARHFEHHPEFLAMVLNLLSETKMGDARGLAILLRNTPLNLQPVVASVLQVAIGVPIPPAIAGPIEWQLQSPAI
jgi:lysine-N-methylase